MSALRRKLLRDLIRLWPQALAIALVLATGVGTMVLANGAYLSLFETRATYYENSRFADIFATATRAPKDVAADIARMDGVAIAEPRITALALADLPGVAEPASVMMISIPDNGPQRLNRVVLRKGAMPGPGSFDEVLISESFAKANGFEPGAQFDVLLNGVSRSLKVAGWALSPEYVYTIGPGELMPDERRFGVVWMPERELAAAYNLNGAFSSLLVKLVPGSSESKIIEGIDTALKAYGGQGAFGRKYQTSHAFLDAELLQLKAMSLILPPIFLLVSAFLVNMTLSRLIALEQEQIGLLKALGYSSWAVARHYLEFVTVIAILGTLIGMALGAWLGSGLAELYARFYRFPSLVFARDLQTYAIAAAAALTAALAGALQSTISAARLPPAIAMAPPLPARYHKLVTGLFDVARIFPQSTLINLRHLAHWPWRTAGAILGVALAVAVLVGSLWSFGSIRYLIDVTFNRSDRQEASIYFPTAKPMAAAFSVARLPGVLKVEPFRSIAVEMSFGSKKRRVALTGRPVGTSLSQVLDVNLKPVPLPGEGVVLSKALAGILGAARGDIVEVKLLEGESKTISLPVSSIVEGYFGLSAYMEINALNAKLGEDAAISGVNLDIDSSQRAELYAQLKQMPSTRFVTFQKIAMQKFRSTMAENIYTMLSVYISFAAIIAFGVVYNFARISLSEQGREMASLRVLGFTRAEVSALLITELAIVVLLAQPLGWIVGYGFAQAMASAFETELYRIPAIVGREVYAYASIVVCLAAGVSALIVRRRVDRLDMVAVLKTRE
ncbi:MAG: ABC transporter permease [Alphaproteobacteria bacterium]|nr:ABC transporter permease [Alphaproteobacteria bacterium]